jgi:hypothetical protein
MPTENADSENAIKYSSLGRIENSVCGWMILNTRATDPGHNNKCCFPARGAYYSMMSYC